MSLHFTGLTNAKLLTIQPDFANPPRAVGSRKHSVADLSQAARVASYVGAKATHVLTQRYVFTSRAAIAEFEEFFYERAGRFDPFWVLSWQNELPPDGVNGINVSGVLAQVGYVDYTANFLHDDGDPENKLGKYIFLHSAIGNIHVAEVNSVAIVLINDIPTYDRLTFAPAVPQAFAAAQFYAGLLYPVRFLNDTLTMVYSGINRATCDVSFMQLIGAGDAANCGSFTASGATGRSDSGVAGSGENC